MSEVVRKSQNVSVLIYHNVCQEKYRKVVINQKIEEINKKTCLEISKRYEMEFIEKGTDGDHTHFLIQSVPKYSPTQIIQIVKSITAQEVFKRAPEVKRK